jgi:hypothetical protein
VNVLQLSKLRIFLARVITQSNKTGSIGAQGIPAIKRTSADRETY